MFKKIGFLVTLAFVLTSVSVVAAPIVPLYVPVEVDLEPEYQLVMDGYPETSFDGYWAGGQTTIYDVVMSYGDGNSERYSTSYKTDVYFHRYNLTGRPSGYKWYPKLTVSNGNTDYDSVVVELD